MIHTTRKLMIASAISLSSMAANAHLNSDAEAVAYKFAGDMSYSSFCRAVVEDNVNMLVRSLNNKVGTIASSRKTVLQKVLSEEGIKCDGLNLIEFSEQREAEAIHAYLAKKA